MIAARMRTMGLVMCGAVLLTGCQQQPSSLTHVRGTVSYKGMPLHDGLIVFTPDAGHGESGPIAYGKIQGDGSFVLQTESEVGAAAGWYRITVAALSGGMSSADAPPLSLIPEKYRDPQLSQVQLEVKSNRDNIFDIKLD